MIQKSNARKSSAAGALQYLLSVILAFVTIPLFVRKLGIEYYGTFAILSVVGSLNALSGLGLNTALVKFLSHQGKTDESDHDIIVTLALLLLLLTPISILAIVFGKPIVVAVLGVSQELFDDARHLYVFMVLSNIFTLTGQTFTAVLDSQQRVYITNTIQLAYNICYWLSILLAVILNKSLAAIGFAVFVCSVGWFLAVLTAMNRVWGRVNLHGISRDFWTSTKKQFGYSMKVYASGVLAMLYEPITRVLISRFIGVAHVGFYDMALRIKSQLAGLMVKILYPLYPLFSSVSDQNRIKYWVEDLERKLFSLLIPFSVLVIFVARPFVNLWLGQNVQVVTESVVLITVPFLLFNSTVVPLYFYMNGSGHAGQNVSIHAVMVVTNLAVIFVLFHYFGYFSVLAGQILAMISSFCLSALYQYRYLRSKFLDLGPVIAKLLVVLFACLLVGYAIRRIPIGDPYQIVMLCFGLGAVSVAFYRYLHFFSSEEIYTYFGRDNVLSYVILKMLCTR